METGKFQVGASSYICKSTFTTSLVRAISHICTYSRYYFKLAITFKLSITDIYYIKLSLNWSGFIALFKWTRLTSLEGNDRYLQWIWSNSKVQSSDYCAVLPSTTLSLPSEWRLTINLDIQIFKSCIKSLVTATQED